MAENPRPVNCPAVKWCDKGNFPCYCEDGLSPTNEPAGKEPTGNR